MKYFNKVFILINCWIILFINCLVIYSQNYVDILPPKNIKTIQIRSNNKADEIFPIITLGDYFFISFDDLNGKETIYYYKIKHYDANWKVSNLLQSDYLEGFDDFVIQKVQTSFNTLQTYTHYQLILPNGETKFKISGNYAIEILNKEGQIIFNRRFLVYENIANVESKVLRTRNLNLYNSHQIVQFSINTSSFSLRNPATDIKLVILQNYQWSKSLVGLQPQYVEKNSLIYRYDQASRFAGGNEYYFFDTKDLRNPIYNIDFIELSNNLYQTYLRMNIPPKEYVFRQDINGDFFIRTIRGSNNNTESDYTWVHFKLLSPYWGKNEQVYVYGGFNNFACTKENRLKYNPDTSLYEGKILFKQGFYNYKYVTKKSDTIYYNKLSGSYGNTENNYLILVYFRKFGGRYDQLVGVDRASSFDIKN